MGKPRFRQAFQSKDLKTTPGPSGQRFAAYLNPLCREPLGRRRAASHN